MKREVIANKGIWIAKKRYMLNVLDEEGVRLANPKLNLWVLKQSSLVHLRCVVVKLKKQSL